jgi:hypothetical protein
MPRKEDKLVSIIFNFLKDHDNNFFKMKKYFQENPQDAIDLLTIGKEEYENSNGVQLQESNRKSR